ncbi:hypothetical protein CONPUDRAFT_137999 [Coniophora puteana RWD-64-598 SS2]|uniref:DUF6534 domain-containing protein n=1 Tax=Coniophora puteana (strain RWD-64-598) TaxID=741705 RepID=A0A5M3MKM1_CONPW|nr:uncharacterized protein CONPUDRAFT_137999 [Coniophora puteana RWD-64-598 SS2]EIW79762.1 hypothetical protein CONPUDRAFT_137999 [Coniophora puteana RWD-64-598 SS2]
MASATLATISLVFALWFGIRALTTDIHPEESYFAAIKSPVLAWVISTLLADYFITGSLSIALLQARTGVVRADNIIYRIFRGAVQAGVFPGVFTLGSMVGFLCWPTTFLDMMFIIPTGRVYTATLLYSLLLRDSSTRFISNGSAEGSPPSQPVQLTSAISLEGFGTTIHTSGCEVVVPVNETTISQV